MEFTLARQNMVDNQLRPNRVNDEAVLARFHHVPREIFVEPAARTHAYADTQVTMAPGREMLQPMVLGRLLQDLQMDETHNVLVVAGGSGYTAALVAPLARNVQMVEEKGTLVDIARQAVRDLNLDNVTCHIGKPENGHSSKAPYDRIILDAPAGEIPPALIEQLETGGKLAAVVEEADGTFTATIYTRQGKTLFEQHLLEAGGAALAAQVLPNFSRKERFVF